MNDALPDPSAFSPVPSGSPSARFGLPFASWSSDRLFDHFRTRQSVRWFAVRDGEQASDSRIDALLAGRFEFNHEPHFLAPGFDWKSNPSQDVEWLILLHKFYFVVGLGERFGQTGDPRCAAKWIELTNSWIDSVPLDLLSNDVTGRRVQNWIYAYFHFIRLPPFPGFTAAFHLKFLSSLHDQVVHLSQHLTPARNHRTIELSAIFLAAVVFPEFAGASGWLELARTGLLENLRRDLLPDGVHCELSTDYHHLVLKNYLNVRALADMNRVEMPAEMDVLLGRALDFAAFVHRPDGGIPALSDGDVRSFLDLLRRGADVYGREDWRYVATRGQMGQPPSERSRTFPAAGYTVLRSGWGERGDAFEDERYLIFDCGPIGEGNHGHLDLLSLELAAYGKALVVDPGRYTYHEPGPDSSETNWRAKFRGTAAHNTVQIDAREQARYEYVKRRRRITGPAPVHELRSFEVTPEFDFVHGVARSHEYPVVHERRIWFLHPHYWLVSDVLRAADPHVYDLRFHLSDHALDRTMQENTDRGRRLLSPNLVLAQPFHPGDEFALEEGYVSRTYGVKHAAPVARLRRRAATTQFHTVLFPFRDVCPEVEIEILPLACAQGAIAEDAFALSVTVAAGERRQSWRDVLFYAPDAGQREYWSGEISWRSSPGLIRQPLALARAGAESGPGGAR